MPDLREIFLAGIVFVVPSWLIAKRREDLLVKWICLTIAIDIFNPRIIVNLPAARLAGLLLVPSSVAALPAVWQSRAGKVLCYYMIYLVAAALVFGFIFPWPSEGYDRLPTQTAQGHVLVYLVRRLADFSLVIFLAQYLWKTRRPDRLIEWFVGGTTVAALGGVLQWLTHVDFYSLLTGAESMGLEDRVNGFNYEPRGLGLYACQGLLFCLILYARKRSLRHLGAMLLHAVALLLSVSTSGLIALGTGATALFVADPKSRRAIGAFLGIIVVLAGVLASSSAGVGLADNWTSNMTLRLTSEKPGSAPGSAFEEFALRLDIFDASAFMFFISHPAYLITGVGPGLMGIASTEYLPTTTVFRWAFDMGIGLNSVPHMGILLEPSDAGMVGIVLELIFLAAAGRALFKLSRTGASKAETWRVSTVAFWVAGAIYIAQVSPLSASFCIFLAIGLAATWIARSDEPIRLEAVSSGRQLVLGGKPTGEGAAAS